MYDFSKNENGELAIWLSLVDDNLIVGPTQVVKDEGKKIAKEIKIEDVGELKEFIGCNIKTDKLERSAKFTQPVMIQSFLDKFGRGKKKQVTSAEPNTVLKRPESGKIMVNKDKSKYQSEIENMMHMLRLFRLAVYNPACN